MEQIIKGDELSQSENIVETNLEKLKALFPEIVTEGKIDFNALKESLGEELENTSQYYRMNWSDKNKAKREAQKPTTGTLRPAIEESIDWDSTKNLYVEGDNLEVLKTLQKGYANKVDLIYIDPPYNTGKDFVYKDDYSDNLQNYKTITGQLDNSGNNLSTNSETEGRYHSNWLNMMYPRLLIARNLLNNKGVIFLSIDNHEVENLKKICSEIFGEDNFVAQFIWRNGRTSSSIYTNEHEYILCYAKSINSVSHIKYEGADSIISDRAVKKIGVKNPSSEISFTKGIRFEGDDNIFPRKFGDSEVIEITKGVLECKDGKLANDVTINAGWVMKDMIESWLIEEEVFDSKGQKVTEFFFKSNGVLQYVKERGTIHPKTIIENISTKSGGIEVEKLMGAKVFDYPKPIQLLKYLMPIASKDALIMDFFSGSASSAQAVYEMNMTDNGTRNFIQIQLPEISYEGLTEPFIDEDGKEKSRFIIDSKTGFPKVKKDSEARKAGYYLLTEIGKERIRRAAKKIAEEHPEKSKNLDLGFKVFKLDTSNIKGWDGNPDNLDNSLFDIQDNIKTDRTEHDVLYEILLKYGLDLSLPIEEKIIEGKTVFSVGYGVLFICLADNITSKVAQGIGTWKKALNPEACSVVFKDSGFTDVEKTNSVQTLKRFGITEIKSI